MKSALPCALLLCLVGCREQPQPGAPPVPVPAGNRLHVITVEGCDTEAIVGSLGGKTYRLTPVRPAASLGVACYMPIRPEGVGHDFGAVVDVENGTITVGDPVPGGQALYRIESATETK